MSAAPDVPGRWALRFLGVGNAGAAPALGSASALIERDGVPQLMIDCGEYALDAWLARHAGPPPALFVTHLHMDHVGGLERLFTLTWFGGDARPLLYVPAALLPHMQARVADYPGILAEGGVNFWEAFRLIPVSRGFWHGGLWYDVFPVRHHRPDTAFGLRLRGSVVWTGDTRPIPEMLAVQAEAGELIAHDCGLVGNPSHTGVDDLEREYPDTLRSRMVLYHYGSPEDAAAIAARGHRVARPGEIYPLGPPQPVETQG
ncbi:MBL fold metallo-hydrolase [Coralloluteibacterium thermophilus]|uniref:MBL fold metallo-hydrolase n=1 Tax=Coralloluteibacterium thermophilum TaxID=2707049 RepID=A0ABV9NFH5_9GAMM